MKFLLWDRFVALMSSKKETGKIIFANRMFTLQLLENFYLLRTFTTEVEEGKPLVNPVSGAAYVLTEEGEQKARESFLRQSRDNLEVLSRDQDASDEFADYENPLYVLVLLHNDEYWGHTYVWLVEDVCFFLGIRKRVDALFLPTSLGVARIMLEAAKQFALLRAAERLAVPSPLSSMKTLLEALEFENTYDLADLHQGTFAEGLHNDYVIDLDKLKSGSEGTVKVFVIED